MANRVPILGIGLRLRRDNLHIKYDSPNGGPSRS